MTATLGRALGKRPDHLRLTMQASDSTLTQIKPASEPITHRGVEDLEDMLDGPGHRLFYGYEPVN